MEFHHLQPRARCHRHLEGGSGFVQVTRLMEMLGPKSKDPPALCSPSFSHVPAQPQGDARAWPFFPISLQGAWLAGDPWGCWKRSVLGELWELMGAWEEATVGPLLLGGPAWPPWLKWCWGFRFFFTDVGFCLDTFMLTGLECHGGLCKSLKGYSQELLMSYLISIMRHPCSLFITHCGFWLWFLEWFKSSRLMDRTINYLERGDRRLLQNQDFVID